MKNFFLSLTVTFIVSGALAQNNVGIGTTNPAANAILELSSSNQGFLMSRLSSSDTSTIGNTEPGMLFYASDLNQFLYFDATRWQIMDTSKPLWAENGNDIFNLNSGNIGIGTNAPFEKLEISTSLGYQGVGINTSDPNGGSFLALTNDSVSVFAQMGLNGSAHPSAPNALFFFLSNPDAIRFGTGNLERMRITGAGNIGIGTTTPPLTDNLYTYRAANTASADFGAGRSNIHAYRQGGDVANEGGTGWSFATSDAALKGTSFWGNNFTAGVAGYNYNDYPNSTGVIGAQYDGTYWGALAFNDSLGVDWGVYTPFDSYVGRDNITSGQASIGTGIASNVTLNIQSNYTGPTTDFVGFLTSNNGQNSKVGLVAVLDSVSAGNRLTGIDALLDPIGTNNEAFGLKSFIRASGTGDRRGVDVNVLSTASSTGPFYGSRYSVQNESAFGTSYGIYSESYGTSFNKYGIYTTGEDRNYLEGSLGIGISAPQFTLDVVDGLSATENILALFRSPFVDTNTSTGIRLSNTTNTIGNVGYVDLFSIRNGLGQGEFSLRPNGTEILRATTSAVGIGTSTPSSILHLSAVDPDITGGSGVWMKLQNAATGFGSISTGVLFSTFAADGTEKGGIFYRRNQGFGIGDMLFSINNTFDVSAVNSSNTFVRMILTSDGDLGVGTTVPNTRLHVNGAAGQDPFRVQTNGSSKLVVFDDGTVTVNQFTDQPYDFYVNGSAAKNSGTTWINTSDSRLKHIDGKYSDGLNIIRKINPIWFRYNGKGGIEPTEKAQVGIIAQELKEIAPYTVSSFKAKIDSTDKYETELYNFDFNAINYAQINAIKELADQVDQLKLETEELRNQNTELEAKLQKVVDLMGTEASLK